ncbi:hypothetical protein CS078_01755 [Pseudomonas prosekii]|uniref:Uncharacterized protein n=1 Tax=Pseudomonas prosekii TaxID=1148509 RepID=A0A3L8CX85_9PSED|nr:hypothetical protein [Pseudomonas prosekii]RLU07279.1 hypothetical protein CS076_19520 [Pseudomonas prosekii]RLU12451.1 hypothetical protein CS078_01755 [Pseudomonas prosekii]
MPIRVDLLALEPNVPGRACLTVKKWQGGEEQLEFSIQRNQDGFYLQDQKAWSNNPFWFKVSRFALAASGEALEAQVGPEVVDPLLEGGANSQFQIELREQNLGHADKGVVRPGVGLLPSTAGGQTRSTYGGVDLSAPVVPEPEAEIPELPELFLPVAEPEPEPTPAPAEPVYTPPPAPVKKSKKGLIALLIVVLLLLAAGIGYWFYQRTPAPAPTVAAPAPAATNAEACTLDSMNSVPELTFVQTCIKAAPDSAKLLEIINQAKASKHCGVAQRLYANRAQAGDPLIANAYAREYDPKYLKASECFPTADNATAAYWYETILAQDPNNAEAKQRFEELQK